MSNPVEKIAELALRVRDGAKAMEERIVRFEAFLSQLKGRMRADLVSGDLHLMFAKEGREWRIFVRQADGTRKPLVDCPLSVKLAAIPLFPDLLLAISKSQDVLIDEMTRTTVWFDAYMAELGAASAATCKAGETA